MTTKRIKIIVDSKAARAEVNALDRDVEKLDSTADRASGSFSKLNKVVQAVGAALVAQKVIAYSDAFNSVQNQVRQTTNSTAELTERTEQLLAVANRSRSDLGAVAELYTQLTLNTEELGLSTQETLRITETISKSFAVSGKSAAESAGAIRQLNQAFSRGQLRGDEFNSVVEGAPELARALRKELKLTQGQLIEFAADGGITSEVLIKGLTSAADVIDQKLNDSVKTLSQQTALANNNLTVFLGSADSTQNIVGALGEGLVFLTDNLETLADGLTIVATAFGAKYVTSIGQAIASSAQKSASNKALLASELNLAKEAQRRAIQEQAAGQRQLKNASNDQLRANAITRLAAANQAASASTNKLTAAQARYNAVASKSAILARGFGSVLGALGGPAGLILTAATSFLIFSEGAETAEERTARLKDEVSALTEEYKKFTSFELEQEIARTSGAIEEQEKVVKRLREQYENATVGPQGGLLGGSSIALSNLTDKNEEAQESLDKLKLKLAEAEGALKALGQAAEDNASDAVVQAADSIVDLTEKLARQEQQIGKTTGEVFVMNAAFKIADERAKLLASGIKEGSAELIAFDAAAKKAIESARRIGTARDADRGSSGGDREADRVARQRQAAQSAIQQEKFVTNQIELELETQRAIYQAYAENRISDQMNQFDQERNIMQARQQEMLARLEQERALEAERRDIRRQEILADETLTFEEVTALTQELKAQELAQEQIFENDKTSIKRSGSDARRQISEAERQAELAAIQSFAGGALKLLQSFGNDSFQTQKNFAIAESIISITSGVAKALDNPYPANLAFAAQVAAQGATLISTIKSTNPKSNSGGSVSVGGGAPSSSSSQPQPVQQPQQQNTVEIRGLDRIADELASRDPDEMIPVGMAQRIMLGLEEFNRLSGDGGDA